MQKTIYICLLIFFSLNTFAGGFDEYGGLGGNYGSPVNNTGGMTAGGNFWSTNVSAMVSNNGVVTNNFDYYSPRYYVGSAGNTNETNWNTAQSVSQYQYRPGDIINAYTFSNLVTEKPIKDNVGNVQNGYIVTNGGSIMQPENNYTGYTPQQISNQIMGIGLHDPNPSNRPFFSYNYYNSSNNVNTVQIYEATANGPLLVSTTDVVTYNEIPRVGNYGFTGQPDADFYAAAQLANKTSLTLIETSQYIEKFIDRVYPDISGTGGRVAQIESAITKLVNGLPNQQKWQAKELLVKYMTGEEMTIVDQSDGIPPNTFPENKNNIFTASGTPSGKVGADGYLLQMEIDNVLRKTSELDRSQSSLNSLVKIVALYVKSKGYSGTVVVTNREGKGAAFYANGVLTVRKSSFEKGLFDNVNNLKSILDHEIGHFKEPISLRSNYQFKDHFAIYLLQASSPDFKNTTDEIKVSNSNEYIKRVLNSSKASEVGMNNDGIILAITNYNTNNTGGVIITNPLFSANIAGFEFTTKINGVEKTNFFKYEKLELTTD